MAAVCGRIPARLARGALVGACAGLLIGLSCSSSRAATTSWSERDVAIEASGATLHGSLVLPPGEGAVPGVLLLAGSGPTDRDGNQPQFQLRSDTLRLLAHGLAEAGIASLRADKRGVGRSLPADFRQQDLRFEHYVDDAVRWLAVLRKEPRVASLFIVGHSEGGLIGVLAAQRVPPAGLVTLATPGFPVGTVLRQQFAASPIWPAPLKEAATHIDDELEAGRTVRELPRELALMFQPAVQPYLISQFRYDPAVEIAKLRLPILILQGDRDLQTSEADAQRLAAAAPSADLAIVHGMNHVLRDAPADRVGNVALYNRPDVALAAPVLPSLAAFLRPTRSPPSPDRLCRELSRLFNDIGQIRDAPQRLSGGAPMLSPGLGIAPKTGIMPPAITPVGNGHDTTSDCHHRGSSGLGDRRGGARFGRRETGLSQGGL